MGYVIYNTTTTILLSDKGYATERAAKAARTRILKKDTKGKYADQDFAISEASEFYANIELEVERVNIMNGKTYMEKVNTPNCCSPSTETYWSM